MKSTFDRLLPGTRNITHYAAGEIHLTLRARRLPVNSRHPRIFECRVNLVDRQSGEYLRLLRGESTRVRSPSRKYSFRPHRL